MDINNYNKQLGLKSISEVKRKQLGKQLIENLKLDWIFNRPIEKIIIAGCFLWSVFSLFKFVIGLLK